MTMEEALGVGYITDAGHTVYNDYVTTSEALNLKHATEAAQEEMEGGSNTATTSAETNDDTPPAEFENTAN